MVNAPNWRLTKVRNNIKRKSKGAYKGEISINVSSKKKKIVSTPSSSTESFYHITSLLFSG